MSYLFYIIILIIAIVGFTIQQNPEADFSSIQNLTWNSSRVNVSVESQPELGTIITSFVNAVGEIIFGVVRWSVDVAREHPNISWKLIIYLVILAILAPIILVLVKLILIVGIFIRDFWQTRKEKREIRRLRGKNAKT